MRRLLTVPSETVKRAVGVFQRPAGDPPVDRPGPDVAVTLPSAERTGKYDLALTRLVDARPGLTVAQAAAELQVHPTALYPVIRRLERQNAVVKLGRELHPAASAPRAGTTERLWCAAGHWWERERTRGRKPARCPEHR